jgi:hypothetical protein
VVVNRPNEPTRWPISDPQTEAGKKAAERHAEWCEQFARVEKVEADHAAARRAVTEAEEAIAAADTLKAGEAAEKRYKAAKDALGGPWQARLQGPVRSSGKAEATLREHVTANLAELLTEPELADAAEDAREGVIDAARRLADALDQWLSVADAHRALVKLADGIDGRSIPTLSPAASEARGSVARVLQDEASSPVFGSNALPAPRLHLPR